METIVFTAFATLMGLVLGSFYNVCIHRYIVGKSIVRPGSSCPACGKSLRPKEMIPIISYIILHGRCSGCHAHIPFRYPVVEGLSALVALLLALKFGASPEWFVYMIASGIFIVASGIDAEIMILPDVIILPGFVFCAFATIVPLEQPPMEVLGAAAAGAGSFWLLRLAYGMIRRREGLGLGDVKLMLMMGALCGPKLLPMAVFLGSLCALGVMLLASLFGGTVSRTSRLPFGPYLATGSILALLYGPTVMGAY